ncbi:hypothetical protein AQUCO_07200073v1 [Aquilegia coerulea]|uniref:WH1 domain-containing protein n=1 Tax=Aquilegia coerulea TaxID=218851 RepID=A0A2G5CA73_AQUCA|nr:hypothetical protein AQUCO_07200073v1 [Aquilegia coerulea]
MSPNVKLLPNLDQESTKVLNLTVLQRIDPFIEEILITAAHVTLYDFSIERSEWSRKDVEGSLFVVKRNTQPRFQFIVMNRRNTENLLGDFEYEIQTPYLLYRNASQDVNGIWFYNTSDCEDVANLFSRILNAYSKVSPKPKVPLTKSDIEELEDVAVMEGPLKPPASTTSIITNSQQDVPFVNIFSAATSTGNTSYMINAGQTHQPPAVIPPSSQSPNFLYSPRPVMQSLSTLSISSAQSLPPLDISHMGVSNHATNLVNPSTFLIPPSSSAVLMPPTPSSMPTAAPPHPLVSPQRPYGAPVLQPFPPPTPPLSLTPITSTNGPIITRDKVRDMLMRLVQNHQFIDMFYEEFSKGIN